MHTRAPYSNARVLSEHGRCVKMQEYFLFALLAVVVVLVCASCCIGCNVRRRRQVREQNAAAYNAFQENANAPANGTSSGMPPHPFDGTFQDMYYQPQYNQGGGQGGAGGAGSGAYFAGVGNAQYTNNDGPQRQQQQQPLAATVLFAATPETQAAQLNFAQYFPEARVAGGDGNAAVPSANYGLPPGSAAAAGAVAGTHEAESPYGEAAYVHRVAATAMQPAVVQQSSLEMSATRTPDVARGGAATAAVPRQRDAGRGTQLGQDHLRLQ